MALIMDTVLCCYCYCYWDSSNVLVLWFVAFYDINIFEKKKYVCVGMMTSNSLDGLGLLR